MKKILLVVATGLMAAAIAVSYAKLPPAPPKDDAEKAAEAQKAAATKAKDAELLNRAQEKAVANYKKNTTTSMDTKRK